MNENDFSVCMSDLDLEKKAVGQAAAELIQDGMLVGLGTGSTAAYFIDALIQRVKQGLKIETVATSQRSAEQAKRGGIRILDIQKVESIDIVVDGADEIDPKKRMIKGGGGALLREKIVASMSREMIVIIDHHKQVVQLGAFGLPVEVIPFGILSTIKKIQDYGLQGNLRKGPKQEPYVTDNGNYIFDITYPNLCLDPEGDHSKLLYIPGVVETGFFFHLAGRVVVGKKNGSVEIIT